MACGTELPIVGQASLPANSDGTRRQGCLRHYDLPVTRGSSGPRLQLPVLRRLPLAGTSSGSGSSQFVRNQNLRPRNVRPGASNAAKMIVAVPAALLRRRTTHTGPSSPVRRDSLCSAIHPGQVVVSHAAPTSSIAISQPHSGQITSVVLGRGGDAVISGARHDRPGAWHCWQPMSCT